MRAIPGQCAARMPRLLPHPQRRPSPQDHEAIPSLLQSRAPSPGHQPAHQPAHPLPIRATPAGQGNDHGSPCPRRLASRLPPTDTGRVNTAPRCLNLGQGFPATTCCPTARYNRIAFPITSNGTGAYSLANAIGHKLSNSVNCQVSRMRCQIGHIGLWFACFCVQF